MNHETFARFVDPTSLDVLCIRELEAFHYPGNVGFRAMLSTQIDCFLQCTNVVDQIHVAEAILTATRSRGVRFLRLHSISQQWYEADDNFCLPMVIMALGLVSRTDNQRFVEAAWDLYQEVPAMKGDENPLPVSEKVNLQAASFQNMVQIREKGNSSQAEGQSKGRSKPFATRDGDASSAELQKTPDFVDRCPPTPTVLAEDSCIDQASTFSSFLRNDVPLHQRYHSANTMPDPFEHSHVKNSPTDRSECTESLQSYKEKLMKLHMLLTSELESLRQTGVKRRKSLLAEMHNSARQEVTTELRKEHLLELADSIRQQSKRNCRRSLNAASPKSEETFNSSTNFDHQEPLVTRSPKRTINNEEQRHLSAKEDEEYFLEVYID